MCNSIYADSIIRDSSRLQIHIGQDGQDVCKQQLLDILNNDHDITTLSFRCNGSRLNEVAYLAKSAKMIYPDMSTDVVIEDCLIQIDQHFPHRVMWFDEVLLPKHDSEEFVKMSVKKANKDACDVIIQA